MLPKRSIAVINLVTLKVLSSPHSKNSARSFSIAGKPSNRSTRLIELKTSASCGCLALKVGKTSSFSKLIWYLSPLTSSTNPELSNLSWLSIPNVLRLILSMAWISSAFFSRTPLRSKIVIFGHFSRIK